MATSSNSSSDIEYVHQLVYELKLNELQFILDAVKNNKFGNKQLLRKRVLSLLTGPASKTKFLRQKIIEVFKSRQSTFPYHQPVYQTRQQQQITQQHQQPPQQLQRQQHFLHRFLLQPSYSPISVTYNEPPSYVETNFEHLPFYKTVETLLKPMHCQPTHNDKANFTGLFYLTDSIRHSIVKSWNIARQEYKIQIILRLARINCNENVSERLPYNIIVSVNDHQCKLPTLNIPTKAGVTPWRCNVPIDITQQTDLRNCSQNTLKITWSEEPHEYMAGVFVAQRLFWNELLQDLRKNPVRDAERTKEVIRKSMESDHDMGVDSMIATVKDPLSKKTMELPARGKNCIHMQCFDAIQFLQMNEQKQTWLCPLCKKKVNFEDIEVDGFFLDIVKSPEINEECENIVLQKDGSWTLKQPRDQNSSLITTQSSQIEVFTLSDSDSDTGEEPRKKRSKYSPTKDNYTPTIKHENILEAVATCSLERNSPVNDDLVLDLSVKSGSSPSTSNSDYQPIITLHDEPDQTLMKPSSLPYSFRYLPNITISESNIRDCAPSDNSETQNKEKDSSRSVICVITLD